MTENTNILNVWDQATGKYVGIPALKGEKGDKGEQGERGLSGLVPIQNKPSEADMIIEANIMTDIEALNCDININLGQPTANYDNEWLFIIKQGQTAFNVTLPQIEWSLGIAPVFSENSVTEVRLHYKGSTLCGVWS